MATQDNYQKGREEALAKARQLKEVLLRKEPTFLGLSGRVNGKPTYCCPFCPSGRGKNRTGISMIPRTEISVPKYHCFACNETASVIDLAQAYYGTTNYKETVEILKQYYQIDTTALNLPETKIERAEPDEENAIINIVEQQTDYFRECYKNLDPTYLEKRGISEATQRHFRIGTDNHWIHPNAAGNANAARFATKRCIIPTSHYSYLARDVRENIPEAQKKHAKMKYGMQHLFNEKVSFSQPHGAPIYVTEGEIDAMSIYEVTKGYIQAIGLGSTGQWNHFVQAAKTFGPDKFYVLMLDNDNAGKTWAKKIAEHLDAYGISYIFQKYPPQYKDPNEFLINDRPLLRQSLIDTLKEVKHIKTMEHANRGEER